MSDAIIVLGRGIADDGSLPPDPMSRVQKAVELFNNKVAPYIVMSGAWTYHFDIHPIKSEAAAMKDYAVSLGVPSQVIIEESESKDTIGNVYFTKKNVAEPLGWHSFTVVASDEHMPRIRYLFEKIYGPGYSFDFAISKRVINDEQYAKELAHETNSMAISKEWLEPLATGDDAALWQLLLAKHPAYSKQVAKPSASGDLYPDSP